MGPILVFCYWHGTHSAEGALLPPPGLFAETRSYHSENAHGVMQQQQNPSVRRNKTQHFLVLAFPALGGGQLGVYFNPP